MLASQDLPRCPNGNSISRNCNRILPHPYQIDMLPYARVQLGGIRANH